jgi:hypothetical protein
MINDIILIGGGKSISEGLALGLKEKIKNKCVFVCNYAMFHFEHSALIFSDKNFYVPLYAKKNPEKNPDIYEDLKKEPLIIGKKLNNGIEEFLLPNTKLIEAKIESPLTGIFALEIACRLEPKNIWLLGYDFTRQPIPKDKSKYTGYADFNIHYYDDIKHRGISYTSFYDRHSPDYYFKVFNNSKSKIYNVSPESLIEDFEKIDYTTMFELLSNEEVNQEEMRQKIKEKLCLK